MVIRALSCPETGVDQLEKPWGISILAVFGIVAVRMQLFSSSNQTSISKVSSSKLRIVDEYGRQVKSLFTDVQPLMPKRSLLDGIFSTASGCRSLLRSLFKLPVVQAFSCSSTPCVGHYFMNDTQECCPAGGGTFSHYISGGSDWYTGWRYTGTEACAIFGCPTVCQEAACSSE